MPKGILCIVIISTLLCSQAAAVEPTSVADSLFEEANYLSAYRLYADLHAQGSYKPIHLLRMAYIQESLHQYPEALYHLMDYYLQYQDTRVWEKIATLSKTRRIPGYELEEKELVLLWILTHKSVLFAGGGLMWAIFVILCLRRKGRKEWRATCLMLCSLCLFLLLERQLWLPKRAVVLTEDLRMREGPSTAAPFLSSGLPLGVLLHVEQSGPIWTKVTWSEDSGYLPTRKLGLLRFD